MSEERINQVRRADREVTDQEWIKVFLKQAPFATVATVNAGRPFININLFAYDEAGDVIYFHTFKGGRTFHNIEADGHVCLSISQMGRLLPADSAVEMSLEYASVVVFGKAVIVSDEDEARHGLGLLLIKYFPHLQPGVDYEQVQSNDLARTAVYRIQIESWSAKQKKVAEDFRGAFYFQDLVK
jgi:nitroimidazol reductase NimA-like FMN-containing flavoprotein (pyridoxamine 5'-phosphate oxidase superfamily)